MIYDSSLIPGPISLKSFIIVPYEDVCCLSSPSFLPSSSSSSPSPPFLTSSTFGFCPPIMDKTLLLNPDK